MVSQNMASRASKNVPKKSTASSSTHKSPERSSRKVEYIRNAEFTGGLDKLKQNLLAEGISERASNLSQTRGGHLQLSITSKLCGWCSKRKTSLTNKRKT